MSGIFGIINKSYDQPQTEKCLYSLGNWNKAYGTQTATFLPFTYIGLGISADHITNAPVNATPVIQNGKHTAVIDAIIYNRDYMISRYKLSSSLSDEELIFSLITKYGFDELSHVNGDFSGAVYNSDSETIVLFTDHMSVRPLYYYKSDSLFSFSTDIRGLIALSDISADINPEYLYATMNGYATTLRDQTELENVYTVLPATYITIDISSETFTYTEKQYWKLGSHKIKYLSNKKYIAQMHDLISESVRKRLAVFPDLIGAELSGGLDSGVIDILINRFGRKALFFSWSFGTDEVPLVPNDERLIIQDICDQENITCNYKKKEFDYINSNIYKSHIAAGLSVDQHNILFTACALPLFMDTPELAQAAQFMNQNGSKVVFTGHGGDEGVSHRTDPYELMYNREYLHCFKYLYDQTKGQKNRLVKAIKQYRYKKARGYSYQNDPYVFMINAPDILKQEFKDKYKDYKALPYYFPFDSIKYINSGATQVRIKAATLFGAYSGARYIFPYLDHEVIDYAVSIPRHMYLKGNQNRYIFRQAFKDLMPKSLYKVTTKASPSTDIPVYGKADEAGKWFEIYKGYIQNISSVIDREYWSRFLDFDVIDKVQKSQEPTNPEDILHYKNVITLLTKCCQFQLMVQKVKNL